MAHTQSAARYAGLVLTTLFGASLALAAPAPESISTTVEGPECGIANSRISVLYQQSAGAWSIAAQDGSVTLSDCTLAVRLGGQEIRSSEPCQRTALREEGLDDLGNYARLEVVHTGLPGLAELVWSATLRPDTAYAVISASAELAPDAPAPLESIQIVNVTGEASLKFGSAPDGWVCLSDSGHQSGTGVGPFFAGDTASLSSPATLVLHDAAAQRSFLLGWLSWAGSNPEMRLAGAKADGLTEASAECVYHAASLRQATSEPLLVSFEPDPLVALEQYAQEVRLVNHPPIRKDTLLGWLSWYCSRLTMTEQFVLDNAKVISERFGAYGVDTMQVDHGWEYRDVVGNWVANERFPHGMKWLGEELNKLDTKLGIWMAVSSVSEHAPFYAEHPDALIHNPDGTPSVFVDYWFWEPHGQVFSLDPTAPQAQEHYRESLQGLMDAGCRYYKVDFIGKAGDTQGCFHDPERDRGNPMLRYEMQQIRDVVGPDSWLRYCSAPSNVYCGIVNIGGATMDIGNASGNWDHLQKYHQQLGTSWYKHRTFWHNEPDALIVGEGEENEARMRCAWLVLSGGVVALGDDLTKIAPERMAMIPQCLPPYDVAARPLDLFEHVPSRMWDLAVQTPWDDYHVVGLFNLGQEEASFSIPLNRLGFDEKSVVTWEFWTQSPVNPDGSEIPATIPGRDCRIVVVRAARERPQVLATDMHLTMGAVELSEVHWDAANHTLSGRAFRAPGEEGTVLVHVPDGYHLVEGGTLMNDGVVTVPLHFDEREKDWSVQFSAVPPTP